MGDTLICAVGLDEYGCASLAFSADGGLLAAGRSNGMVSIWRAATGEPVRHFLHDLLGHPVCAVAFSADGTHLASAGGGHVVLRDLRTGRVVWKRQHPAELTGVAFGPAGDCLTTACGDGKARTWTLRGRLAGEVVAAVAGGGGTSARTPDGRLTATVEENELRVYAAAPTPPVAGP